MRKFFEFASEVFNVCSGKFVSLYTVLHSSKMLTRSFVILLFLGYTSAEVSTRLRTHGVVREEIQEFGQIARLDVLIEELGHEMDSRFLQASMSMPSAPGNSSLAAGTTSLPTELTAPNIDISGTSTSKSQSGKVVETVAQNPSSEINVDFETGEVSNTQTATDSDASKKNTGTVSRPGELPVDAVGGSGKKAEEITVKTAQGKKVSAGAIAGITIACVGSVAAAVVLSYKHNQPRHEPLPPAALDIC